MAKQKKTEPPAGYVAAKTLVADGRRYKAGDTLDVRPGVLACMIRTGQALPIDTYEAQRRKQQAADEEQAREQAIANAQMLEAYKGQQPEENDSPPVHEPPEDYVPPPEPKKQSEPKAKTTSKK